MADKGNVYIRRLDTREIVYTIPVSVRVTSRGYEQFMRGLLRKTDTDRFFVDDSEIQEAACPEPADEVTE